VRGPLNQAQLQAEGNRPAGGRRQSRLQLLPEEAKRISRDDDQLRSITLYTMMYGSNVAIARFNIPSSL
jgi:hypothetical protein